MLGLSHRQGNVEGASGSNLPARLLSAERKSRQRHGRKPSPRILLCFHRALGMATVQCTPAVSQAVQSRLKGTVGGTLLPGLGHLLAPTRVALGILLPLLSTRGQTGPLVPLSNLYTCQEHTRMWSLHSRATSEK